MKNKKAQILSIFLSACILGTSAPVSAADLSSELFSADDITDTEAPADTSQDQPAATDEASSPDSTDTLEEPADDLLQSPDDPAPAENGADDPSADSTDPFSAGEEDDFSDSEGNDDFSSGEAEQALAGILDDSLETQMARKKGTVAEADIPISSSVSTTCTVYKGSNLESQNYTNWSAPVESYLTTSPDGYLMRVQSGAIDGKILIEYYDSGYNLKKTMTLDLPLPEFGGFYETGDNYYILTGQNNTEKDNNKEVYRVCKYSKTWQALGSCGLFGANTTYPFDAGSARMAVNGKYLFVRTCHEMYNGHQANVTFSVDTSNMSIADSFTSVMNTDLGYVSHSFNQFIQIDNGTLLGSDHGDAYPRAITVLQYRTDISNGSFVPQRTWGSNTDTCREFDLMTFPGSIGNNYTGASQGGFEYSDSSYLAAGNYDADDNSRNVFVASVSKSGGTPVVRYFSNYAGTSDSATTPHLVKTGSNSFVLLWSSQGYVYYTAIDGTGQQVGSTYKMAGNLSDCVPSIINGKLIWYAWKNNHNTFYEINLSDLSSNHATRIENGHKYVYGTTVENNQVDKTCRVCGITSKAAVPTKISAYITPSNSSYHTLNGSEFLTKDLTYTVDWSTWFSGDSGDDYLSDCTISCSDNSILTVQQTSNSVAVITPKKSGKAILTIQSKYNPSVVFTSELYVNMLSEDVFTFSHGYIGYYDGTKKDPEVKIYRSGLTLTEGTDYTATYKGDQVNVGTFTVTFTGIGKYTGSVTKKYTIQPARIYSSSTTCAISPENCIYDGKPQEPNVVITDHGKALTRGRDYTVEYQNNTSIGRARAGITGIGNYSGYFTTAFYINRGSISNCDITLSDTFLTYDGTEKKPLVTVKCNGNTLTEDQDYHLYYRSNTNAGTASVTISGTGNFYSSASKTFQIEPADISKYTATLSQDSFSYDGSEKCPDMTITNGNTKLTYNTDYSLFYKNNVNTGTASVTATGKGNYTGSVTKTFQIKASDFSKCDIQLSASSFTYDGTEKKPEITVKSGSKLLVSGTDYAVSYSNNINVGTASVAITGKGKYSGTITKAFSINPADFTKASVTLSASSFTWDGTEKKPEVTAKIGNRQLTANTDYTVSYKNNVSVGTSSVTLTAKGNYTGSVSKNFSITAADFTKTSVSLSASSFTYDGAEKKPGITVKNGSKLLTANTDYTVSYKNNINAGTASVTITGKGSYSGSQTKNFTINPADFTRTTVSLSASSFIYDGAEKKPEITVKTGNTQLTLNKDYTISYKNNTNVGTASVTVTGKGNYSGSQTKDFTITAATFTGVTVTLSNSAFTYDGTEKKPGVTVKAGSKLLSADKDYTFAYANNINAGTASVIITGKGSYSGSTAKSFTINPADLSKASITLSASSFIYDGTEKKPEVTISIGQKHLSEETDYTLSYKNNTNIGTASVTASGTGNYTGSISKTFNIAATDLSTADVKLSAASFTYNGKAITPSVIVTCNDKALTNGTDYSVAYTSNINAGTARVTITGIGAYSGVKTVTFRIKRAKATLTPTAAALTLTQSSRKTAVIKRKKNDGKISLKSSNSKIVKISGTSIIPLSPGKATVTITAAQGKNYNAVSAKISISVRPLPVSSLSLKSSAKGQATVSWKQVKSITSYQIQYSTASSMKSARTITVKGASKSAVLKKLTRGKKYYVRIRTVKTVSKKNYYSTWSKTASVKVK